MKRILEFFYNTTLFIRVCGGFGFSFVTAGIIVLLAIYLNWVVMPITIILLIIHVLTMMRVLI